MESKELRIGNLVKVENILRDESGYIHKITEVRQLDCQVQLYKMDSIYGQKYKFIKPIELTEEWLLKLGFTQSELNKNFVEKSTVLSNTPFDAININFSAGIVTLSGGNEEFVLMYKLPKVHELQNLYFALTGSELVLSEV